MLSPDRTYSFFPAGVDTGLWAMTFIQLHTCNSIFFALPGRSFFAIFYIECIVFAVAAFKPQPSHVFFWPRSNPNFPMCPFGLDRTPVVPQIRTPTFPCVLCRLYIYTPTNVYIWTHREYITASYTLISLNPNLNPYPCRFQSRFILYLLHNPYPNTFYDPIFNLMFNPIPIHIPIPIHFPT